LGEAFVGKRRGVIALAIGMMFATVAGLVTVTTASAATNINVVAGQSIQAAINSVTKANTHINVGPGTYNEALYVNKNKLSIIGDHAILEPPTSAPTTPCNGGGPQNIGICIEGASNSLDTIESMTIENFTAGGILVNGVKNVHLDSNVVDTDGPVGIDYENAPGVNATGNVVFGSMTANILVNHGVLPSATLVNNIVFLGGYGIEIKNSPGGGNINTNVSTRNCVGIGVLTDGTFPTSNWFVQRNDSVVNQETCDNNTKGTGLLIEGADNSQFIENSVTHNNADGPPNGYTGGIVLIGSATTGGVDPTNVTIGGNVAFHNEGGDINFDGSGVGNIVTSSNRCEFANVVGQAHNYPCRTQNS
jgi:hypothetical protein